MDKTKNKVLICLIILVLIIIAVVTVIIINSSKNDNKEGNTNNNVTVATTGNKTNGADISSKERQELENMLFSDDNSTSSTKSNTSNNSATNGNTSSNTTSNTSENTTNDSSSSTKNTNNEKTISVSGTYLNETERTGEYHRSDLTIENSSEDSITFSLNTAHGRDVDHVSVGELKGTAQKIEVPSDSKIPDSTQYAYQFTEVVDGKTNKITFVYTAHRTFEYITIAEEYQGGVNPYGGNGVSFQGEYEKK